MIPALIFILHFLNTYTKISLSRQKPTQSMGCVLHFTYYFWGLHEVVSKICTNFKRELLRLLISQLTELYAPRNFKLRCGSRYQQIDAFALNSSFIPQKRRSCVAGRGERSLQIVWKALMYLIDFKGNSLPFLKIKVQSGITHCAFKSFLVAFTKYVASIEINVALRWVESYSSAS